jgi:hypothetical protein
MRKILLLILLFYGLDLKAQLPDSVIYDAELQFAFSSQDYLSQWILSNRYGVLDDQSPEAYFLGGIHAPYSTDSTNFKLAFGFDYLLKPDLVSSRIQQAYAKAKFHFIELAAGRVARTVGTHNPELSTGSLALSRNARPMPIIRLGIPEYTPVPFTKEIVSFKGHVLHGWFEEGRYIDCPLLHEKSFYLKIGAPTWLVSVYGGLIHFAQWGGSRPNGTEIGSGLSNFWRVFTGRQAANSTGGGEFVNALGNHLGILDLGINLSLEGVDIQIYQQDPFEDELSLTKDLVLYDQLLGINVKSKQHRFIQEVVYEYLNTTLQGGSGLPDPLPGNDKNDLSLNYGFKYGGRDDYYNNYLYRNGWTYQGRMLGNPLLLSRERLVRFLNDIPDFTFSEATANNRVRGHHLGVKGKLNEKFVFRLLATYTRNYGTYAGLNDGRFSWASREPGYEDYQYAFKKALNQGYTLLEGSYHLKNTTPLEVQFFGSTAYDFGDIYQNFTVMAGVKCNGAFSTK